MEKKTIITILGPTAVGKTKLSVELAKKLNCSIISADARQFYKEMSIGTAKPTPQEMDGVQHHFINSHTIQSPITAAQFEHEFLELLENSKEETIILTGGSGLFVKIMVSSYEFLELLENSKEETIILTGGSGLFVKAALEGLQPIPTDEGVREKLQSEYEQNGIELLLTELEKVDAETYAKIDRENPHRVIRALEVYKASKKPMSWWIKNSAPVPRPFDAKIFILERERSELYERINQRVLQMIDDGLEEEVVTLRAFKSIQPLKTVGYQEWWPYFDGTISKEEVIAKIQQNSRRYAKRQLTWLRGQVSGDVHTIDCTSSNSEKIVTKILETTR